MEIHNFEEKLIKMTKPEVSQLKHQEMLSKAIIKAKEKSVVSWWWLSIPLYIIVMLLMKSVYMPHTTLISGLHELARSNKYSTLFFFLILPVMFIIINFISIRKIYFLSGSPGTINFLQAIWFNVLIIIFSILILIIYSL
jgi:hypothetical protein